MVYAIKFLIMILVMVIWSVLGLLLWIPLLFRVVAGYTMIVMASTFSNQDTRTAGKMLDKATRFYVDGFKKILDSVWEEDAGEQVSIDVKWMRFFLEALYSVVFWFLVYSYFNPQIFNKVFAR
ncbi:hypothetical protein DF3PB_2490002 [uncultured Defluviicoccus sp.]|uniref:Uncharacterized protein n=1 Tax=metagenome TaxID=256318 RepID=A0A380TCI0_9ZZZZ|nr:hypothetical protein DF3PB_2490002 [uncultured Defluviicoccus sp.]